MDIRVKTFNPKTSASDRCVCGYDSETHRTMYINGISFHVCPEAVRLEQPTEKQHVTEERFPEQCAEFKAITQNMYEVHLNKNADYSPMNILATGMVGLMTRMWDKMARMMNLAGFNIQTGAFGEPKEAKNESFTDSLIDIANYAIITLIYLKKKWGR